MEKDYKHLVAGISSLIEEARRASMRSVNTILTVTYWEVGRRIVEFEQGGQDRARYGERLLKRLSVDLQHKIGRGFTERNLRNMRQFYQVWLDCLKFEKDKNGTQCVPNLYCSKKGTQWVPNYHGLIIVDC